jgi:hypothetical protein
MATIKTNYGASNQAVTITLNSLNNTLARSSAAIDNTTNLYVDALIQLTIKTGGTSTQASGVINIFAYGTTDGGTTYPDGSGTDVGLTLLKPTNFVMIGQINAVANAVVYKSEPFSIAAAFGGVLPASWGIVVENQTGDNLDATAGGSVTYQGIKASIA